MPREITNLGIPNFEGKVLLGLKKRGFGAGKWNGFGGKVENGETIEASLRREFQEECGLQAIATEKIGILEFEYKGANKNIEMHIFKIKSFEGEMHESEEMQPQWFLTDQIPLEKMWLDDKIWIPHFLANKKFKGYFLFEGFEKISRYELKNVEKF